MTENIILLFYLLSFLFVILSSVFLVCTKIKWGFPVGLFLSQLMFKLGLVYDTEEGELFMPAIIILIYVLVVFTTPFIILEISHKYALHKIMKEIKKGEGSEK